jgi:hypothetical protein
MEGTIEENRILIRIPGPRPEYLELPHPLSQGARVEAQDRGGPVLSLDAPSGFRKVLRSWVGSVSSRVLMPDDKGMDQQWDVRFPLPEWRDSDGEDVEPIVKVQP